MTNYLLMFDNQKIILYANKKNTPSRDGYMITQIKRSFLLVLLYKYQIKYVMFAPELPFLFFCI